LKKALLKGTPALKLRLFLFTLPFLPQSHYAICREDSNFEKMGRKGQQNT